MKTFAISFLFCFCLLSVFAQPTTTQLKKSLDSIGALIKDLRSQVALIKTSDGTQTSDITALKTRKTAYDPKYFKLFRATVDSMTLITDNITAKPFDTSTVYKAIADTGKSLSARLRATDSILAVTRSAMISYYNTNHKYTDTALINAKKYTDAEILKLPAPVPVDLTQIKADIDKLLQEQTNTAGTIQELLFWKAYIENLSFKKP